MAFALKGDASALFADYTKNHVGEYFAIVLDGTVISAPSIRSPITGGSGIITTGTGAEAVKEMNNLVTVLRYGSLPFPIQAVQDSQISATLGKEFLTASLIAGAIGIGLVFIFMLIYYRLPGVVADLALIYYALVVLAIFRIIPVTLTLAGIAGFVLSVGMAVDANILIFERTKEELRLGKSLNVGGRGRLLAGLELDPRLERVEPDHGRHPVRLRLADDQGLRPRPHHRRADLDVHGGDRLPDAPPGRRPPGLRPTRRPVGRLATRSSWPAPRSGPGARRASVYDIIGKRKWFFLFSGLMTIPGLIFILLTPITNGQLGLQFSIDYTGGTNWEIKFADPNVAADQVKASLARLGVTDATVIATSGGFYEIRTRQVDLPSTPVATPTPSAAPSASAGASGAPSASAASSAAPSPAASGASAAPSAAPSPSPIASASAGPSASAAPSAAAGASTAPGASPAPSAAAGTESVPTTGQDR